MPQAPSRFSRKSTKRPVQITSHSTPSTSARWVMVIFVCETARAPATSTEQPPRKWRMRTPLANPSRLTRMKSSAGPWNQVAIIRPSSCQTVRKRSQSPASRQTAQFSTRRRMSSSSADVDILEQLGGVPALAEQIGGVEPLRVLLQLFRRAVVDDAPALEHVGAVREPERDVDELLDQEHAHSLRGRLLERRDQALDDDRREPERQLVDEHELGSRDKRLGENDHLLLA